MSEPFRAENCRFLVSLAGGNPVPKVLHGAARTKRLAEPTADWKPNRWHCQKKNEKDEPCMAVKEWPCKECWCVQEQNRKKTWVWKQEATDDVKMGYRKESPTSSGASCGGSMAAGGAAGGAADSAAEAADSAAEAAEKASDVIILTSSDEDVLAGMSPKEGAPHKAQARDTFSGKKWTCPMCTFADNRLCLSMKGREISLPCEVCRYDN